VEYSEQHLIQLAFKTVKENHPHQNQQQQQQKIKRTLGYKLSGS
jgi:hypothetical protein